MEHKISKDTIKEIWGKNKGNLIHVRLEDQGFEKLSVVVEFTGDNNPKNKVSTTSYLTQSGFLSAFNLTGEITAISFNDEESEVTVEVTE